MPIFWLPSLALRFATPTPSSLSLQAQAAVSNTPNTPFIRKIVQPDGTLEIQTSAHKLTSPGKPDLWLVGVAHIGLKDYYARIQALLDSQSAVLYEGVRMNPVKGEEGQPATPTAPPPGAPKQMYTVLGQMFGLDFQLFDINYDRKNWVNADIDMDTLQALYAKSGGAKSGQFNTLMTALKPGSAMATQLAQFASTATPGTKEALKIFMIDELSNADPTSMVFDPTTQKVILSDRNKVVEEAFDGLLKQPTKPKSVAIFYGALHQQAISNALSKKYGYTDVDSEWFTAATADPKKLDDQSRQMLATMEGMFSPKPADKTGKPGKSGS